MTHRPAQSIKFYACCGEYLIRLNIVLPMPTLLTRPAMPTYMLHNCNLFDYVHFFYKYETMQNQLNANPPWIPSPKGYYNPLWNPPVHLHLHPIHAHNEIHQSMFIQYKRTKATNQLSHPCKGFNKKIAIGCKGIDTMLGGGFPTGIISELCRESSWGKTQLCLQLALTTQLLPTCGGVFGSSIYMHSNMKFPLTRLTQISAYLKDKYGNNADYVHVNNITIMPVDDPSALLKAIKQSTKICEAVEDSFRNVRLIVVDSIASIFQCAFDDNQIDMTSRSKLLQSFP